MTQAANPYESPHGPAEVGPKSKAGALAILIVIVVLTFAVNVRSACQNWGGLTLPVGLEQRAGQYVLPLTWTTHNPLPDGASPFCHFDRDGRIAFQGHPEFDDVLPALRKPGTFKLGCTFNVPGDAKGRDFTVYVGLWSPTRQGARNHEERLLPDAGEAERRVLVGRLQVNASGQPTLEVAQ